MIGASLVAQTVKNLPTVWEIRVQTRGREDPLEKEVATHSSILASNAGDLGSIPESGRAPGEGNGNPLQYSCLENPMDGEAW